MLRRSLPLLLHLLLPLLLLLLLLPAVTHGFAAEMVAGDLGKLMEMVSNYRFANFEERSLKCGTLCTLVVVATAPTSKTATPIAETTTPKTSVIFVSDIKVIQR